MNSIPMNKQNTTPALTGISAYETFADQAIGIDAQLVKFVRGVWSTGADGEIIKPDARFLAGVTGLRHGHIKWQDGRPVERRMILVQDHPLAPGRTELGELLERDWPIGKDGTPADPWIFTFELPLLDLETDGARLYSTSSFGGRQCIGRLVRTYAQRQRKSPGQLPVISLGCESYKHETYGIVHNPALKIAEWLPDPDWSPSEPSASSSHDLDDSIPF